MERLSLNGTSRGLRLRLLPNAPKNLLRHTYQPPGVNHRMEKD